MIDYRPMCCVLKRKRNRGKTRIRRGSFRSFSICHGFDPEYVGLLAAASTTLYSSNPRFFFIAHDTPDLIFREETFIQVLWNSTVSRGICSLACPEEQ
jgi:hypothetical protein